MMKVIRVFTRLRSPHSDHFVEGVFQEVVETAGPHGGPFSLFDNSETKRKQAEPTQNSQNSICTLSWYGQEEGCEITG